MSSYIKMSSAQVCKLAQTCLENIEQEKAEWKAEWIASERSDREESFWRKLFRIQTPSDEELSKEFEKLRQHFGRLEEFWEYNMIGALEKPIACDLLRASKHATEICVLIEDLSMIC